MRLIQLNQIEGLGAMTVANAEKIQGREPSTVGLAFLTAADKQAVLDLFRNTLGINFIEEAPNDGHRYVRQSNRWVSID